MLRRGIQPLNQPAAAPRSVPPVDSVGEVARFPLARWIAGEVAALLRAADVDGEALATLTENDMQALVIELFGRRRRLTLRLADSLGATIGRNAPFAVATVPEATVKAAEPRPPTSPRPSLATPSSIRERRHGVRPAVAAGPRPPRMPLT